MSAGLTHSEFLQETLHRGHIAILESHPHNPIMGIGSGLNMEAVFNCGAKRLLDEQMKRGLPERFKY